MTDALCWLAIAGLSAAGVAITRHLHVVARRWDDDPKPPPAPAAPVTGYPRDGHQPRRRRATTEPAA